MRKHFENREPLATLWCDWSDAHLNFWRESVFAQLSDILQLSACYNAACEEKDQHIHDICQFWDTTVFFSHVNLHKMCVNSQQNIRNFAMSVQKKTSPWKKYNTTGCGGCEKYQIWINSRLRGQTWYLLKKITKSHCYLRPKHKQL